MGYSRVTIPEEIDNVLQTHIVHEGAGGEEWPVVGVFAQGN